MQAGQFVQLKSVSLERVTLEEIAWDKVSSKNTKRIGRTSLKNRVMVSIFGIA
jgi:hypothetical protein